MSMKLGGFRKLDIYCGKTGCPDGAGHAIMGTDMLLTYAEEAAMNDSKKLVMDTLEMCSHSRAPREMWTLPWADMHHPEKLAAIRQDFPSDFTGAPGFLREADISRGDMYAPGKAVDAWGCEFVSIGAGAIGEVKNPQIQDEDWADAENVHIPREWLSVDVEKVNAFCRDNSGKFIFGGCCPGRLSSCSFCGALRSFTWISWSPAKACAGSWGRCTRSTANLWSCGQRPTWTR